MTKKRKRRSNKRNRKRLPTAPTSNKAAVTTSSATNTKTHPAQEQSQTKPSFKSDVVGIKRGIEAEKDAEKQDVVHKFTEMLKRGEAIPTSLYKIKNVWVRRVVTGAMIAVVALVGGNLIVGSMQNGITGVSVEYQRASGEKELPFATILQQFKLNGHRVALFNYLDEEGLKFSLFDMDDRKAVMESTISGVEIQPNSVAVLAQILPDALKEGKDVKSIEKTDTGFVIDGKKYDVELEGVQVKAINGAAVKYRNVFLVSKSHEELIKRNKINTSDLRIGFVGRDPLTDNFTIAGIDSKSNIYTFNQDDVGKVKIKIQKTE